jgi:predicted nuclease with TOPRIM domain
MRTKKIGYFLSVLLLFSAFMYTVDAAPDTTVTFRGNGVTIDLTFPDEAHPNDNISHNATLKANTGLTLYNLTLVIKAPVDSTWQETTGWYLFNRVLQENESRTEEMNFQLASNVNGTLQCFIYISTNQSTYYLSTTFYTTQVREMTYSELLEGYNELNNTYNQLVADCNSLNNTYKALNASYNELFEKYNALNNTYNQLVADFDDLNNTYNDLQSSYAALNSSYNELSGNYSILKNSYDDLLVQYTTLNNNYNTLKNNYNELDSNYNNVNSARNSLLGDYSELQSIYDTLNSTFYSVQGNYTDLKTVHDALNQTYYDLVDEFATLQNRADSALNNDRIVMFIFVITLVALIAFIIYLKRGKEEPYVVIRKETVSMDQDENT